MPAEAATGALPEAVEKALRHTHLPESSLSVWVQDTAGEEPMLSHHADLPRSPASTIKLLTTLAALEELGPAYEWETGVYVTGPVHEGRLEGDLVLVGSGDPFLVVEQLWRLLASVHARGLREVAGRLVIDNSRFSAAAEPPPGDFDDKPYRAYNALPDALLVNFNALDVVLEARGGEVHVWTEPAVAGLVLRNRLVPAPGGCALRNVHFGVSGGRGAGSPTDAPLPVLTLSGRFPLECRRWAFPRSVLPPARFADGVVRALWAQMGGRIEGGLVLARLPEGAMRWHRHRSPPLSLVVRGINKFSNNVMARNLLLTLGVERFGAPGTTYKGRQAVEAWLERRGVRLPHLRLENGSGLSRDSRISARGLGRVLLAARRSRFWPEFAQSLPLASLDESLQDRFTDHPDASRARIKTGLLDDVRTLAGYVTTPAGRTLAVVALQEHPGVHRHGRGIAVQDALVRWLLNQD